MVSISHSLEGGMKDFTAKVTKLLSTGVLVTLLLSGLSQAGKSQCDGVQWDRLANYQPGSGGACKVIGLDTNKAVCPYYEEDSFGCGYTTYCDDASGGRYRLCRGPRNPDCHTNCNHPHHRSIFHNNLEEVEGEGPRGQDWTVKQVSFKDSRGM